MSFLSSSSNKKYIERIYENHILDLGMYALRGIHLFVKQNKRGGGGCIFLKEQHFQIEGHGI